MPISFFTIKQKILEIWNHAGFQKYFRNTGWMFFGHIFSLAVSFFIGAWLARYLGPENYGTLNYIFAFVGMFSSVANLGIATILFRELAKYPEKKDELLGTSFVLLTMGGAAAFILIVVFLFLFESSIFIRSLIVLYSSSFLWSGSSIIQIFFQSLVHAKKNVQVTIISIFISSILKIILILTHKGIIWLILIFLLESLLVFILNFINYKISGFKFKKWTFNSNLAKNILSGSLLLMLATSTSFLFMKIDQVMVKYFLGTYYVGLYATAVRFVEIWYFIPGFICSSLFPAIVNAKKESNEKYHKRLKKLYIFLFFIALFISIILTIFARFLIKFIFGDAYLDSTPILQIYAWSSIGLFLFWGVQQYYLLENKLKTIFYLSFFSMIMNIVLNLILIPRFLLNGAAWATLISYSFAPIFVLFINLYKNKIKKYD